MADKLDMGGGNKGLKFGILGAIAVAIGVGGYSMIKPGEPAPQKPEAVRQAQLDAQMNGGGNAPAAADPAAAAPAGATAAVGPAPAAAASPSASAAPAAESTNAAPAADVAAAAPAAPVAAAPAEPAVATPAAKPSKTTAAAAPADTGRDAAAVAAPAPASSEPASAPPSSESGGTVAAAGSRQETASNEPRPEDAPVAKKADPAPPAADALRQWWAASEAAPFNVQYVGQAADQQAIVIRFNSEIGDTAALGEHIQLMGPDGKPVQGNWQKGEVSSVVYVSDLQPGRYTVMIEPELKNASGRAIGTELYGPVYVQG
jgi:hypothetical protein